MSVKTKVWNTSFWTAIIFAFVVQPSVGQADEMLARNSDKEVKALAKNISTLEKQFEKSLDSKFKRSILRGPGTELQVDSYLKDLSGSIKNLENRFTGEYAASAEATEVLTRSSTMHGYIRKNPSLRGANEWDAVAANLQQLATVYGVSFPLGPNDVVRRIGDGELAGAADELRKFAGSFQKVLGKSTSKVKELKEPVKVGVTDLKFIASSSKTLASRIRSGKPASAEARQLIDTVARVDTLVYMEGMPESVAAEWKAGAGAITKISQAFGLATPE